MGSLSLLATYPSKWPITSYSCRQARPLTLQQWCLLTVPLTLRKYGLLKTTSGGGESTPRHPERTSWLWEDSFFFQGSIKLLSISIYYWTFPDNILSIRVVDTSFINVLWLFHVFTSCRHKLKFICSLSLSFILSSPLKTRFLFLFPYHFHMCYKCWRICFYISTYKYMISSARWYLY